MENERHLRMEALEECVRGTLAELHRVATEELRHHDFGLPRIDVGPLFAAFARDLHLMPEALNVVAQHGANADGVRSLQGLAGRANSLTRAAASLLLSNPFRGWMSDQDVVRAWATKILCIRLFDLVDDLVDEGSTGLEEANSVIGAVLENLTKAEFDPAELWRQLTKGRLAVPAGWATEAIALSSQIRTLLHEAPQFPRVAAAFRADCEGLAAAQAVSGWLRLPRADLRRAGYIAREFDSPSTDVSWEDRYVGALTWTGTLTLVDLANASGLPYEFDLGRHLEAWYYIDVVMGAMDHFVTREGDLGRGIVNSVTVTLAQRAEEEGREPSTLFPRPTMGDYERLFARWAEYTRRALDLSPPCSDDSASTYRCLAAITPIMFFHQKGSEQLDSLHAYLRVLAAVLRSATDHPSANGGRIVAPPVTTPRRTRSMGRPRGRIGS